MKKKNNSGFTLIEVLITSAIMVVALVSTLGLFGYLLSAAGGDRSFTIAEYEAERQMETILAIPYSDAKTTYTNNGALKVPPFTFDITGLSGKGVVYANELPGTAGGLMRVKVVVCYRDKDRVIGEDTNFNGILDGGEDANGNGELDSPCQIETVLANK